jgi:hypothetical protein
MVNPVPDAKSIGPVPTTLVSTKETNFAPLVNPNITLIPVIESGTGWLVLEWQGLAFAGENDPPGCKTLQIRAIPGKNTPGEMVLGPCGGDLKTMPINRPELTEMVKRFGPFELRSQQESLVFRGQGQIDSPAWHRAVLAWAQFTYSEAATGHVYAACRTVMSWYFGSVEGHEGLCKHQTFLNFGYAYSEFVPCSGGSVVSSSGAWIETGPWEQFDEWLYGRARVDQENNYFDGKGSQPMSADELAQLEDWARVTGDR